MLRHSLLSWAIACILLLSLSPASARDPVLPSFVNLNAPDSMERLKASSPDHHAKIQRILSGVSGKATGDVAGWIRTSFNATDVIYTDVILVSFPPQKDLVFVLDNVQYRARLTLERDRAVIYPVRNR